MQEEVSTYLRRQFCTTGARDMSSIDVRMCIYHGESHARPKDPLAVLGISKTSLIRGLWPLQFIIL